MMQIAGESLESVGKANQEDADNPLKVADVYVE